MHHLNTQNCISLCLTFEQKPTLLFSLLKFYKMTFTTVISWQLSAPPPTLPTLGASIHNFWSSPRGYSPEISSSSVYWACPLGWDSGVSENDRAVSCLPVRTTAWPPPEMEKETLIWHDIFHYYSMISHITMAWYLTLL